MGYKVWFFAFEVGARGLVSRSNYIFLGEIGLTSKVRSKAMTDMSRAVGTRGVSITISCAWTYKMRANYN